MQKDQIKEIVCQKFGEHCEQALTLINRESRFNLFAVNKKTGACGLFQNINCDYDMNNVNAQVEWGFNYIKTRYGSAEEALNFWNLHHWY